MCTHTDAPGDAPSSAEVVRFLSAWRPRSWTSQKQRTESCEGVPVPGGRAGWRPWGHVHFPECGEIRIVPGEAILHWLCGQAVVLRVKDRGLFPKGTFEFQRDHVRVKVAERCWCERGDHGHAGVGAGGTLIGERAKINFDLRGNVGAGGHGLRIDKVEDRTVGGGLQLIGEPSLTRWISK